MTGKRLQILVHLLEFCTMVCCICIGTGLVIRGNKIVNLFPSIILPLSLIVRSSPDDINISVCSFKTAYGVFAITVLAAGLAFLSYRNSSVSLSLEENSICEIHGTALYDSTFSSSGNRIITIKLCSCSDVYGNTSTARGTVCAVGHGLDLITSGLGLSLEGRFNDEGLFIYDKLQVTKRHLINDIREKTIAGIQRRIFANDVLIQANSANYANKDEDSAVLLSLSLLTGGMENQENPLREKAMKCGCVHVLALSGMHVSVFASLFLFIGKKTGRRKLGRILASFMVLCFTFVAGNRPSILRAVIMFFLPFIPEDERLIAAYCIHAMLFPLTMNELGCTYAYLSMAALIYLKPSVQRAFSHVAPCFLLDLMVPGLCVLLTIGPVLLASDSSFSTGTVVASAVASFLVRLSMILGLLVLVFGRLQFLLDLMTVVYRLLDRLFDLAHLMPSLDSTGYMLLLFSVAVLVLLSQTFKEASGKPYKIDGN